MIFRNAMKEDIPICKKIFEANSYGNGGTLPSITSAPTIDNLNYIYVMESKGKVIAYVVIMEGVHEYIKESQIFIDEVYKDIEYSPKMIKGCVITEEIYIEQCAVDPQYQALGVGVKLYENIINGFKGHTIYSHVAIDNINALKLHLRMGFNKVGVLYKNVTYDLLRLKRFSNMKSN